MIRLLVALCLGLVANTGRAAEPRSFVVVNLDNGETIAAKSPLQSLPIASITKLMALLVILDANQDLDQELPVITTAVAGHKKVSAGMWVSRRDLINLSLINSDNRAVKTLAYHYPGGESAMVQAMNNKAVGLDMYHTLYVEPTGLSARNTSTAMDLVKLLRTATTYPLLTENANKHQYQALIRYRSQLRLITANNTNASVRESVTISKTGFTGPAGFCLAWVWNHGGQHYAGVVLNHPSKKSRKQQVDRLMLDH